MAQKKSYSAILKKIVAALSSIAKAKALAFKSKTNAIKARIVIFSLLNNKKFAMSSISHKFQDLLTHHHVHQEPEAELADEEDVMSTDLSNDIKALEALHSNDDVNALVHESIPDYEQYQGYVGPMAEQEFKEDFNVNGDGGDEYSELQTHDSVPEMEDVEMEGGGDKGAGSVIEMVKNSKQEKGEEFRLEDEIDHIADLFIQRFHHHMLFPKQNYRKRLSSDQNMLQSCGA